METQKKSPGIAWIVFFVSFVALILGIVFHFEFLTLILPIMCTSFVKAMNII